MKVGSRCVADGYPFVVCVCRSLGTDLMVRFETFLSLPVELYLYYTCRQDSICRMARKLERSGGALIEPRTQNLVFGNLQRQCTGLRRRWKHVVLYTSYAENGLREYRRSRISSDVTSTSSQIDEPTILDRRRQKSAGSYSALGKSSTHNTTLS